MKTKPPAARPITPRTMPPVAKPLPGAPSIARRRAPLPITIAIGPRTGPNGKNSTTLRAPTTVATTGLRSGFGTSGLRGSGRVFADNGASSSIGATYPGRSADAIQPPGTGDPFERVPDHVPQKPLDRTFRAGRKSPGWDRPPEVSPRVVATSIPDHPREGVRRGRIASQTCRGYGCRLRSGSRWPPGAPRPGGRRLRGD